MTCDEVEKLLDDYSAKQLPPDREAAVRAHVQSCEVCGAKFKTATQTVELLRGVLEKLTPGEEFEDKVTSKIIELRNSQTGLQPVEVDVHTAELTAAGPEAGLFRDPAAARERRRLRLTALVAALLFAAAVTVLVLLLRHTGNADKPKREKEPPVKTPSSSRVFPPRPQNRRTAFWSRERPPSKAARAGAPQAVKQVELAEVVISVDGLMRD